MSTPAYYYSNTAVTTSLVGGIDSSATTLTVDSVSGYPGEFPYVIRISEGTPSEELVKVTSAAGEVLTVERAFGGTSAQSHGAGAEVKHVYNAVDATDFRAHEAAATGVHGVDGDLVGTANTQTLSNKTLTDPVINSGTLNGSYGGDPTLTGDLAVQGQVTVTRPDAEDSGLEIQVTGDTHPRVRITAGGIVYIGSGSAEPTLQLRLDGSAVLETPNILRIVRPAAGDNALQVRVDGDTVSRLMIDSEGRLHWGPGGGGLDTNLYRSAAGLLKTDDRFEARVQSTVTGASGASGWFLHEWQGRKTARVCEVFIRAERTGSNISPNSQGNITDVQMATIPSGWRPGVRWFCTATDGFGDGAGYITEDGEVHLATWSTGGTVQAGRTIRITTTYILPE